MNPEDAKKFSLPAFPQKEPLSSDCHGMELRDYFAAKAMQGMWASDTETWRCSFTQDGFDSRARYSYMMADAMLKAREVQP